MFFLVKKYISVYKWDKAMKLDHISSLYLLVSVQFFYKIAFIEADIWKMPPRGPDGPLKLHNLVA